MEKETNHTFHKNYGWVICAACTLCLFCSAGLSITGFSIYPPFLIRFYGLNNTQTSLLPTIRSLFGICGLLITSKLVDRFEIRRTMTIAMCFCGTSFLLYGFANSFIGCAAAAACAGFGYGCGSLIPASLLISRWFNKHRGLAIGICMASSGLSATIASPVITAIVNTFSPKTAFFGEAVFVFVAAVIGYAVLRSNPRCVNAQPIGTEGSGETKTSNFAAQMAPKSLYYCMLAGMLLFGMSANGLHPHFSVLFTSVGMESATVASLISMFGLFLAFGKCAYGAIADWIGTYRASWILYGFVGVGSLLCCLCTSGSYPVALTAVVLTGFGLAVTSVSQSMYSSGIATEKEYPKVVTSLSLMSTLGGMLFSPLPGIIADATGGNYFPAFWIMFGIVLVSSTLLQTGYLRITSPGRKNAADVNAAV